MQKVECVWSGEAALGEGPVWDAARNQLWFVDIKRRSAHLYDPDDHSVRSWHAPTQIGWILPCHDGTMLAGLENGLAEFDPESGLFTPFASLPRHPKGNRLNDAAIGPDGTVWFGSMDDGERRASGRVFRLSGRTVHLTEIRPVAITNGPALSPDGATLYHVDTAGGVIHAVSVGPGNVIGDAVEFVRIDPADGNPDGVTVDAAGNIWVGLWGGWSARLYAPDATLLREVRFPVANVTKIALGGRDLKSAFATTATAGLDAEARGQQPLAGGLFRFSVDIPGQIHPPVHLGEDNRF